LPGYFARRLPAPLALAPVTPAADPPGLRFAFAMAAGVRRDDVALRDGLQAALDRRADDVRAILDAYGVPRAAEPLRLGGRSAPFFARRWLPRRARLSTRGSPSSGLPPPSARGGGATRARVSTRSAI